MVGGGEVQTIARLCEEVLPQKDDVAISHNLIVGRNCFVPMVMSNVIPAQPATYLIRGTE
jgi:hypothetical protein